MVSIIEHYGGSVGNYLFLVEQDIVLKTGKVFDPTTSYDVTLMKKARKSSSDDYLACLFLTNACRHRYGEIVTTLHNQYVLGIRTYHSTFNEAYSLIDDIRPLKKFATAEFSALFAQVLAEL